MSLGLSEEFFCQTFELFLTFGGLKTEADPSHGFYLHQAMQYRKKRTNSHASSGIRTHDTSVRAAKTQALHRTRLGTFVLKHFEFDK
jgi:hypothetical protein